MFKMKVRDYQYKGRHFVLGELEGRYVGIEHKHIDKNGCMKVALNGLQMFASRSLEECMNRINNQIEVDELVASGMDTLDAIRQVVLADK